VEDARSLVSFTEYMLNVLGDPAVSASDKDEIIRFSYRKAFRDSEVHIEDDLVMGRNTVTQKDVQAYLKDITFFYKSVNFRFEVEGLTNGLTEQGQPFFLLHTMRHLHGVTLDGDTVKSLLPRYFEVNVDETEQIAYIASVYTHRIGEEEALAEWWNGLSTSWKGFFGAKIELAPGLKLKPLLAEKPNLQVGDSVWVPETVWKTDSTMDGGTWMQLASEQFFFGLRSIISEDSLDLSYQTMLVPLDPLSRFDQLRYLDLSHTQIVDLSPIRNLVKLEALNCSYTGVEDFSTLRYLEKLSLLDVSHTRLRDLRPLRAFQQLRTLIAHHSQVSDIAPLASLRLLQKLDLSNTKVKDLSPLRGLTLLEELKLGFTPVEDLTPLGALPSLQAIYLNNSSIAQVAGLAGAPSLRFLMVDYSQLASLEGLESVKNLERVSANGTPVSKENAMRFMRLNPGKMVLFQDVSLRRWWEGLSAEWRTYFLEQYNLPERPSDPDLQMLVNVDSLDLRGHTELKALGPLSEFIALRYLNISGLQVTSLAPVRYLLELEELHADHTPINTIPALESLPRLKKLSLAHSRVGDIRVLEGLGALEYVDLRHTLVGSLKPLHQALKLKLVLADSTSVGIPEARGLYKARPACLLVFQTPVLQIWWESMSAPWQNALLDQTTEQISDKAQLLHTLAQLKTVNLIDRPGISRLSPVRQLWNLRELRMINTRVENLEPLSICTNLEVLVCSSSPVTDLTPLVNLGHLRILDIENTPVESLDPIANLVSIQDLRVSGTQIKDLKPLEGLVKLHSISCHNTRIRSLRPLEGLKDLRYLSCYNTKVPEGKISSLRAERPDLEIVYY
jgi:Leucine-rich repeat (LRR) protein